MRELSKHIKKEIRANANTTKAKFMAGYFKTAPGEYGHGDIFLGLTVPLQRKIVKKYLSQITLKDLQKIIKSKIHEDRTFVSMSIAYLAEKEEVRLRHPKSTKAEKNEAEANIKKYRNFYFKNKKWFNNWDLIDGSAHHVLGPYYINRSKSDLMGLIKSKNIWERRIALLTTYNFIRNGKFDTTLILCKLVLKDSHDLIHKASGWMLREMGNRNQKLLLKFLDQHAHVMPRTMLRYSIERLSAQQKKKYMAMKFNYLS